MTLKTQPAETFSYFFLRRCGCLVIETSGKIVLSKYLVLVSVSKIIGLCFTGLLYADNNINKYM